jgi:polysaccharide export outer membrane protein
MHRDIRIAYAVLLFCLAACSSEPNTSTRLTPSMDTSRSDTSALAQTQGSPPPSSEGMVPAVIGIPQANVGADAYRIGPDDVLDVTVFQVDELSAKERVSQDGTITMPLIGPISVSGLTSAQAESRIAAALQKDYLQKAQVDVFVAEQANMKVTVGGAVKKPGVFPLSGQTTLLQAIAQAEGATRLANEKEVILFRKSGSDVNAYVVNVSEIQRGKLTDPVLAGGDKIMVPESGSAVFVSSITDTLRGFVHFPALGL